MPKGREKIFTVSSQTLKADNGEIKLDNLIKKQDQNIISILLNSKPKYNCKRIISASTSKGWSATVDTLSITFWGDFNLSL